MEFSGTSQQSSASRIRGMALEAWIAFLYVKSLHKGRMLHGDVCDNNRGPRGLIGCMVL